MADKKVTTPQAPPPQFSVSQLQQYIQLQGLFNDGTPKSVVVSQQFLDWYKIQVKQVAKNFNIPEGKGNTKNEFMGVELVVDEKTYSKKTS